MLSFSSDVDLAKFEPGVFGSWFLSSQVLCGGANGIVAGTQFTASGVDFTAAQAAAGGVIYLESADGAIKGAFEIVSVDDATHLTVSVLRVNNEQAAIPVGSASGRLSPGCESQQSIEDIVNAEPLRAASIFGVLAMVFESLYTGDANQTVLVEKKEHYQWRYDRELEQLTVRVDTNDDGSTDKSITPSVVKMQRR
ncbi:MAG: hypothetical protein ACYSOI_11315 [Planctomycetota bacterium]|jgi:hypothetical protein